MNTKNQSLKDLYVKFKFKKMSKKLDLVPGVVDLYIPKIERKDPDI